jgi:hypothetical protein
MRLEGVNCINVAQGRENVQVFVKKVINFRVL